jgi:hypothetical protein
MELASELERALAGVCAAGPAEVRENGKWLASLDGMQYEVRSQGPATLLHLWSSHESLVRRVIRFEELSKEAVVLEVARFGHSRNARLEVTASPDAREIAHVGREQWCDRLRQILTDRFPDEAVASMVTGANLSRSLSGSFARGVMVRGRESYAVLGAGPDLDHATIDGILTFGILWLDQARERARGQAVRGLRLLVPRGTAGVTAHRLAALASPSEVELYEYEPLHWRVHHVPVSDAGNLATWLIPRRELDAALATASPEVERIRQLDPDAIRVEVAAANRDVALRFRGLEFARYQQGAMWFGLGERSKVLTRQRWPALEALVRELGAHRHPLVSDTKHKLYRAQPERWLETMVAADPARIDARIILRPIYSQIPAFVSGNHGIIDLLGITRDGRLAVLELKASEDIQLILQAVDYWLRVRWHQQQNDFRRFGYFPDMDLQAKPPLLFLVAPSFQFHPSAEIVLRYLSREIELVRIGLSENWRQSLRVVLRQ